jgi:hypothetical protein
MSSRGHHPLCHPILPPSPPQRMPTVIRRRSQRGTGVERGADGVDGGGVQRGVGWSMGVAGA